MFLEFSNGQRFAMLENCIRKMESLVATAEKYDVAGSITLCIHRRYSPESSFLHLVEESGKKAAKQLLALGTSSSTHSGNLPEEPCGFAAKMTLRDTTVSEADLTVIPTTTFWGSQFAIHNSNHWRA